MARLAVFFGLLGVVAVQAAGAAAGSAPSRPRLTYVLNVRSASASDRLLAASLQGIANHQPVGPRVFLIANPWDEEWLSYAGRIEPSEIVDVETPADLYARLRGIVKGQVLYDPASPYTIDLATTAAGLRDLVISDVDLGIPTLYDLRGRFSSANDAYGWAITELLPKCDRAAAALLPPDSILMRDFAIAKRLFVFSAPGSSSDSAFNSVLFHLPPGTAIYGSAGGIADSLSRTSHFLVPAAQAANLSYLSAVESGRPFHQHLGYLEATAPRYLTLILDCSDLDFALTTMPDLWQAPQRGSVPLGWAIPAALADAAAPVARRFYADAYWSGMDQFVLGPSGAGRLDLSAASAPYSFYRATRQAGMALDTSGCLFDAAGMSATGAGENVSQFIAETGMRGVFLTGLADAEPMVFQGTPVIAAPRVRSVEAAVNYLDRIPLARRGAALVLDPEVMGPADAAHIAAHVAGRYVTVPPGEMLELLREIARPEAQGTAGILISSVDYTERPLPDAPVAVSAAIQPPEGVDSAQVVYRPATGRFAFEQPLLPAAGGAFSALLPPLLQGGEFNMRVRARDDYGRIAWSPAWNLTVPRADADSDGLSDAEEAFMLTDARSPDSDGDGLLDGNDPDPLLPNRFPAAYCGPVDPPSDMPYLIDAGGSVGESEGRVLQPGGACQYWLPIQAAPPDAAVVVVLDATGQAEIECGTAADQLTQEFSGPIGERWYSRPLPPVVTATGVFVRVSCPRESSGPLVIHSLRLSSPPGAPSVFRVSAMPPYPGPEQAILVSAVVFSPTGVAEAKLAYRVNGGGRIALPMVARPASQTYEARIPALENGDQLEYWIIATGRPGDGNPAGPADTTATVPAVLPIGGRAREVVSLLARRDFIGGWTVSADWDGSGSLAPNADARDYAYLDLAAGTYTVWALAGGRGQGIDVYVKDARVGSIDRRLPDGWQRIGRVRVDQGRTRFDLVAHREPDAPEGAAPRYAGVIVTADSSFAPPAGRLLDIHNSIALLSPSPNQTLSATVEVVATGAGNVTGAEVSLDGEIIREVSGPPFRLSLNTQRYPSGPHRLKVEAVGRQGPLGVAVEVPVTIAASQSR